ncbi:hypothetical protein BT69DRAFT_1270167 [Atractiella rhizophila]|nr:hypothetical protein BT69DRAFT_1270167 [Atractiella rhizophila]
MAAPSGNPPGPLQLQAPIVINASHSTLPPSNVPLTPSLISLLSNLTLATLPSSPVTALFYAERLFSLMPQAELAVFCYASALKAVGERAESMRVLREGLVRCKVEGFRHSEAEEGARLENEGVGGNGKGKLKEKSSPDQGYILAPVPVNTLQRSTSPTSSATASIQAALSSDKKKTQEMGGRVWEAWEGRQGRGEEKREKTVWNFPAEIKVYKYPLGVDAITKLQALDVGMAAVDATIGMDANAFDTMARDILGSLPKFPSMPASSTSVPNPLNPLAPAVAHSNAMANENNTKDEGSYLLLPSFLHSGPLSSPILQSAALPSPLNSKMSEQRASYHPSYSLSLPTLFLRPAIEVSLRCCELYAEMCAEEIMPRSGGMGGGTGGAGFSAGAGLEEKRAREGLEYLSRVKRLWEIRHSTNITPSQPSTQTQMKGAEDDLPPLPPGITPPSAAVGLECKLARLALASQMEERAAEHYEKALAGEGGRWCWEALEGLAKLGRPVEEERLAKLFAVEKKEEEKEKRVFIMKKGLRKKGDAMDVDVPEKPPSASNMQKATSNESKPSSSSSTARTQAQFTFTALPPSTTTSTPASSIPLPSTSASGVPRQAGNKRPRSATGGSTAVPSRTTATGVGAAGVVRKTSGTAGASGATAIGGTAPAVRRSTRLGAGVGVGVGAGARGKVSGATAAVRERKRLKPGSTPISSSRGPSKATSPVSETDSLYHVREPSGPSEEALTEAREAEAYLCESVRRFASISRLLEAFRIKEALQEIEGLGEEWRRCWKVYEWMARGNMELGNHEIAEKCYLKCRSLAPRLVSPVPLYSTVLWHLQKPVALSALAQDLQSHSRNAPQTWIVSANLFSYLSDNSNTLRALDRARECFSSRGSIYTGAGWNLNDDCYSLTLSGHECVAMQEYERAIGFYREALRRNSRHFNAWFGLGNCYEKTGRHKLAGYHYARAIQVNPTNAIIATSLAGSYEQQGKFTDALEIINEAIKLQPNSPTIKFRRLTIMGRMKASLLFPMLHQFVQESPQETTLHMMFAKLCAKTGEHKLAKKHFGIAADLDSNLLRQIKEFENKMLEDRSTLGNV